MSIGALLAVATVFVAVWAVLFLVGFVFATGAVIVADGIKKYRAGGGK